MIHFSSGLWLTLDPVGAARKLVTACRASGQRRETFEKTIMEGNEAGGWGDPPAILRVVGLLKDVETRWSATFLMIDRVLEQYQVSFSSVREIPAYSITLNL
jgi:hypothetical protein